MQNIISLLCLLSTSTVFLIGGCHLPRTIANPELRAQYDAEFSSRKLDPIEGFWRFRNRFYDGTVVIYKSDPSQNNGFAYASRTVSSRVNFVHHSPRDPFRVSARYKHSNGPIYNGETLMLQGRREWWTDITVRLVDSTTIEMAIHGETPVIGGNVQRGNYAGPRNELEARLARAADRIDGRESGTSGTGFLLNDRLAVTSLHVVDGMTEIECSLDGLPVSAEIVLKDRSNDIALLRLQVPAPEGVAFFRLGAAHNVRQGQDVYALGYPLTDVLGKELRAHKGIISSNVGIGDDASQFQVEMALNPGNSGGPIVDDDGRVVGLVRSKLGLNYAVQTGTIPEGVTFASKADMIRTLIRSTEWAELLDAEDSEPRLMRLDEIVKEYGRAVVLVHGSK